MGLKDVRTAVVAKLKEGRIQHETDRSGDINEKNLLSVGKIKVEEVIELINSTKGDQFSTSDHHTVKDVEVHVFKPVKSSVEWYIKCYFLDPDIWFISVHKSS